MFMTVITYFIRNEIGLVPLSVIKVIKRISIGVPDWVQVKKIYSSLKLKLLTLCHFFSNNVIL